MKETIEKIEDAELVSGSGEVFGNRIKGDDVDEGIEKVQLTGFRWLKSKEYKDANGNPRVDLLASCVDEEDQEWDLKINRDSRNVLAEYFKAKKIGDLKGKWVKLVALTKKIKGTPYNIVYCKGMKQPPTIKTKPDAEELKAPRKRLPRVDPRSAEEADEDPGAHL